MISSYSLLGCYLYIPWYIYTPFLIKSIVAQNKALKFLYFSVLFELLAITSLSCPLVAVLLVAMYELAQAFHSPPCRRLVFFRQQFPVNTVFAPSRVQTVRRSRGSITVIGVIKICYAYLLVHIVFYLVIFCISNRWYIALCMISSGNSTIDPPRFLFVPCKCNTCN